MARELTAIENLQLSPTVGQGQIIAITGPPGVGKSCLIDRLLQKLVLNHRVAVLAVDPSSPLSGGALLGDRIRMTVLDDPDQMDSVYFRSIATRDSSGSVPSIVKGLAQHLLGNSFDLVLIETVGTGQADIRCAAVADRIVLVEGPARGDVVQAEKAGVLELADLIVVNKSDLDGAEKVVSDLTMSLQLGGAAPPIIKVSAKTGEGIDEFAQQITSITINVKSKKAKIKQNILMMHEFNLTSNPLFGPVIDRIAEEGLSIEDALEELR